RVTMIDARDAAGAVAAFAAARGVGPMHELTDARRGGYTWRELIEAASGALDRKARPLRLPAPVLRLIGAAGAGLGALGGGAEMLTPGKAREILHPDWSADPSLPPPPATIWVPRIGLEAGLAAMVASARAAGRLRTSS
ncbi:MAG: hypothetical protein WD969_13070, partial [Paracoccaceae bacterium]